MSMRARMHPRNIYRKPPNFKELAIEYPEFRKYVKQELTGKVTLDYNDRRALTELTKLLLLKDFGLRVEVNEARLIPRVPLCLNYVLWIEDLLGALNKKEIRGVDIGTGSVCIYSLLASTKGWKMLATEIDKVSFESARANVEKNSLGDVISLKFVEDKNQILDGVLDNATTYDFCMCNPPFFDENEKPRNRTSKRKIIETTASFVNTDVNTKGGEVEFIKKLIDDSQKLKEQISIYTSLIGKKSDFYQLKKEIGKINPVSVANAEFCQGNTTRWGLAWSFSITLPEMQKSSKTKKDNPKALIYEIPDSEIKMDQASAKLEKILGELEVPYTKESALEKFVFTIKAYDNTWSYQRRKNRLKQRENKEERSATGEPPGAEATDDRNETSESPDDSPSGKKMKMTDDRSKDRKVGAKKILVECAIILKEDAKVKAVELNWMSGDKESVHQIYQQIKNKWTKMDKSEAEEAPSTHEDSSHS